MKVAGCRAALHYVRQCL